MSVAPPTIEMLWESVDPQIALKRFGFSDAASTARWVTAVVEAEWGTTVVSCERIVLSAGSALAWVTASDQRQLIAKWSVHPELFERLAHVSRLTSWLDAQGFPVSAPIPPLHGGRRAEVPGASMELQAVVPGSLLDVRDPGQVYAVGAAHAGLHGLLADYPGADEFERTRGQRAAEPLVDRITHWLHSDAHRYPDILTRALRQSLEETSAELPPVQLVHNDFRAANLLCRGGRVVAVLDFEEAALDHVVVDVAEAAVLLGTLFRDWKPIPPETRDTFLAGYRSVRPMSRAEASWLRTLILWTTMQIMHGWNPDEWLAYAVDEASQILN